MRKLIIGGNMINLKRLKDIREDNDLSQKQMAEILNENRSTYSLWEIGNNIIPIKKLSEFADYFNVSIDYVLSLTNDKGNIIKGFDSKKLGENIKHIRIKNNLTQEALGKMLNITQAGVARIEKGKGISTITLYKFCTKFNTPINEICGKKNKG